MVRITASCCSCYSFNAICVLLRRSALACQIAIDSVSTVTLVENGRREIDIKRYAKVEKVGVIFAEYLGFL